jgi:diguanylate cyclase (GGDEF)-like protein
MSLRQAALYDPLTRLPNRRLLDLDSFKSVNDTFGHNVGDEVLIEVASRLIQCVRACDTLARHGGDEYVVLLEEIVDRQQALPIGERVLAGLHEPVRTVAGAISVSASIGIHVATDDDDDDSLLRAADGAMYEAKRNGHGGLQVSRAQPSGSDPSSH